MLDNPMFRAGVTAFTCGLGGFLFFTDLSKWLNKQLDSSKKSEFTQFLMSASLLDNGIGMAWSRFLKGEPTSWNDHAASALIQMSSIILFK